MRLEDYQKKVFEDLYGLYKKGQEDNVPENHCTDISNTDFEISEWRTRPGLSSSIFPQFNGNIRRFVFIPSFNIILIMDDNSGLYTYSQRLNDNALTPIITVPNASDFSMIEMLGKVYITFHDGQFGLQNQHIKVYIPDPTNPANDVIRDAAGLAPTAGSAMIAATSAGAGIVNAGTYQIAVAYITSTGFITQPGPKIAGIFTATTYVAPGVKKINLSNIPLGPAGTTSRQILITKANLLQYFFLDSASGGVINDNTTTTAVLNFDDTIELVSDATYLFNLLETIPASLALQDYNGRLITAGEFGNTSIIRGSRTGDVESFDAVSGFHIISKDDGFTIRNLLVIRATLYIWKNLGAWYINDNGDNISNWSDALPIDRDVGTCVHGIAEFFSYAGVRTTRDWTLVADRSGILLFNGIVTKPQVSNKINGLWKTINFNAFHKIQMVVDETTHKIYCCIPTGTSVEADTLLCGDYNLCPGKIPESTQIKWSPWTFNVCGLLRRANALGMFNYLPDTIPTLKIGSVDGGGRIWTLDPFNSTDDGDDIVSYFQTSPLFWEPGFVHFFTASRLRVNGSGSIASIISGEDNVLSAFGPSINLTTLDYRFIHELATDKIDGSNTVFNICRFNNLIMVFQNGLHLRSGIDYTPSNFNSKITFTTAPLVNDTVQFIYVINNTTTYKEETPTGLINGSNNIFTLSQNSVGAILGFHNGLLIRNGIDFSVVLNVVTMFVAPQTNDTLQFFYQTDTLQTGLQATDFSGFTNGIKNQFSLGNFLPDREFIGVWNNGLLIKKFIDFQLQINILTMSATPPVNDSLYCVYRPSTIGPNSGLGVEKLIRYNFQNEKAKIKFQLNSGKFIVSKLEFYGKPQYPMRPQ